MNEIITGNQVFNPYLPSWEYVPDGEPHIFDGRVYVYGSHDRFGAPIFCVNDYVCWSAPLEDLSSWKYEGVIYRKRQDPKNPLGIRSLYAPDVTKGPDGRYYLYYAFDFMGQMGVAVCDTPAGQYEYYGEVKFPDGHVWGTKSGEPFAFDPGVLTDDDGRVYLYSGFATKVPSIASRWHNLTNEGGVVLELEQDMVTIRRGPQLLFPTKDYEDKKRAQDTNPEAGEPGSGQITGDLGHVVTSLEHPQAFPGHAFFEASSIRKIDGRYCFVYSSERNHELCYAVGDTPFGPFTYGGTLVDLGDIGINGVTQEQHASNYLGNTHGGMCYLNGDWYIFYHRQTNRSSYARQGCAERLVRSDEIIRMQGSSAGEGFRAFRQAEVTSCGLNGGPLQGKGRYEARIACNLWSGQGTGRYDASDRRKRFRDHPYFTQSPPDRNANGDQYIANMQDGAVAGFKYFRFENAREATTLTLEVRGQADGAMQIATTPDFATICGEIKMHVRAGTKDPSQIAQFQGNITIPDGIHSLYFRYQGTGALDLISFTLA